ncbi:hypothetical protein [Streptomyces sp. CAU 1734]|uniref:hypothetical protein n=1 Tax=Streptomyces sp. CAU 1734 TaxID=3140360 RepID=UPI003260F1CE
MDIPVMVRWALLALMAAQLFPIVSALRRMRRPEAGPRGEARLDLADALGCVVLLGGFAIDNMAVALSGLAVMGVAISLSAGRELRARRRL